MAARVEKESPCRKCRFHDRKKPRSGLRLVRFQVKHNALEAFRYLPTNRPMAAVVSVWVIAANQRDGRGN